MKILVDAFFFQLARSGIARVWNDLLEHWTQVSADLEIHIMSRGQKDLQFTGCEIHETPPLPIEKCWESWSLEPLKDDRKLINELCSSIGIDVFMSTYYTYSDVAHNALYIHDCIPENFPSIYNMGEPIWQLKTSGINHSHSFICVSEHTANDLYRFYNMNGKKVIVAKNAVSRNFFNIHDGLIDEVKRNYSIDLPYVLVPGLSAVDSYKNNVTALKGVSDLVDDGQLQVVCTGGGATRHLEEYSDVIDISKIIVGNFSENELVALYSNAVATLYPSKYEGFGLPILESLAVGTPVITCQNSSLAEVGGDLAIYVNENDYRRIGDLVTGMIRSEFQTCGFKALAKERARQFSWWSTARTVDSHIRQVILEKKHSTWMKGSGF